MQVLLLKDVKGLGRKGEKRQVSDGHARNFLIPNGFVVAATAETLAEEERKEKAHEARERREKKEAVRLQSLLQGKTVIVRARVSDAGNLYAAVGALQVAEALKNMDAPVDAAMIRMQPIKHPGTTEALLVLHQSVSVKMYVQVVAS
jgi:large subunit ribosomal protein L9